MRPELAPAESRLAITRWPATYDRATKAHEVIPAASHTSPCLVIVGVAVEGEYRVRYG